VVSVGTVARELAVRSRPNGRPNATLLAYNGRGDQAQRQHQHLTTRECSVPTLALPPLAATTEQLEAFCRTHHIRWLAVFGSVLRDDFGPESDVDVLVEFEEGHSPGLTFVSIADELERIVGRPVDLLTPPMLSRWMKPLVMRDARVLYDAA
jgi:uncharacterized protein